MICVRRWVKYDLQPEFIYLPQTQSPHSSHFSEIHVLCVFDVFELTPNFNHKHRVRKLWHLQHCLCHASPLGSWSVSWLYQTVLYVSLALYHTSKILIQVCQVCKCPRASYFTVLYINVCHAENIGTIYHYVDTQSPQWTKREHKDRVITIDGESVLPENNYSMKVGEKETCTQWANVNIVYISLFHSLVMRIWV